MELFRSILLVHVIWFCEITPSSTRYRSTSSSRAQVTVGVSGVFDHECMIGGCKTCSTYNGCMTCRPRLFLLLHRSDMKHIGICTHACPIGYYGHRTPEMNMCYRCRVENCEECFSRNFCTRCSSPYYLLSGKCVDTCPDEMYPDEKTGECKRSGCRVENCEECFGRSFCTTCAPPYYLCNGKCVETCPDDTYPDEKTGECIPTVNCDVSTWSAWGICHKMGKTCGFKWGLETRSRVVLVQPSSYGRPCPTITESKQCKMKPRHCADYLNSSEPKLIDDPKKKKKEKEPEKINRDKRRRKKNKSKRRRRNRAERKRRRKNPRRSEKKREKIQRQTLTA